MNRKEFIATLWKRTLKPTLLVLCLFFSISFLIDSITHNGEERFVIILLTSLFTTFLLVYLLSELFTELVIKVKKILPPSINYWLTIFSRFISFLAPFITGAVFYHYWQKDWIGAAIVAGVFLIEQLARIIKSQQLVTTRA